MGNPNNAKSPLSCADSLTIDKIDNLRPPAPIQCSVQQPPTKSSGGALREEPGSSILVYSFISARHADHIPATVDKFAYQQCHAISCSRFLYARTSSRISQPGEFGAQYQMQSPSKSTPGIPYIPTLSRRPREFSYAEFEWMPFAPNDVACSVVARPAKDTWNYWPRARRADSSTRSQLNPINVGNQTSATATQDLSTSKFRLKHRLACPKEGSTRCVT
ncbi:hypothetical protein OSTOST_19305 [Ostertagia ostertagi]